jgi:hypothetical protein
MAFYPGHFLARVIAFCLRRIGILDAVRVNDTECRFVSAQILGAQHPPLAAAFYQVQYRAKYIV